ncbi:MAG: hypothetical protein AAGC60_27000 [Acidobacteriota bacterium]
MFRIEMLPARQGDCLWIEYGQPDAVHRVLIDGGVVATYDILRERLERLPRDERRFELVVVTHVDRDHIEGILKLLGDARLGLVVDEIWYNGWRHLDPASTGGTGSVPNDVPADLLGPLQGEFLSAVILERQIPWNVRFGGGPVAVDERPRSITLGGGLEITLLAPDAQGLARIRDLWRETVVDKGLDPGDTEAALEYLHEKRTELVPPDLLGDEERIDLEELAESPFSADRSRANASSIAFLATYDGKTCLFAGDAPPGVLAPGLAALGLRHVDAWKLAHHGSKKSTSGRQLATLAADRYLFSTDGSYFRHPDDEILARILANQRDTPKEFVFNYPLEAIFRDAEPLRTWRDPELQDRYRFALVENPVVEL